MARTEPLGPTRLASSMAVSPKPHPTSTTLSPVLTLRPGITLALCSDNPPTRMCRNFENLGTRTVFQNSTEELIGACVCAMLMTEPPLFAMIDSSLASRELPSPLDLLRRQFYSRTVHERRSDDRAIQPQC